MEAAGARWLVDAGNGAPFFDPVPLDRPFEIRRAGLGYRFHADAADAGTWVQERALEDGWRPFCRYPLQPQSQADREIAYQRHHRPRETWVTNAIVLVRSGEDEVFAFRNGDQTRYRAEGKVTKRVQEPGEWARLPGLVGLPALPVAAAARAWAAINGQPIPPGA